MRRKRPSKSEIARLITAPGALIEEPDRYAASPDEWRRYMKALRESLPNDPQTAERLAWAEEQLRESEEYTRSQKRDLH